MAVRLSHLPKQSDFFWDDTGEVAFVAGLGYGKTFVGCDKMLRRIAKYGKAESPYIFSNTYDQLHAGTLHSFFERLEDTWIPGDPRFAYKDRVRYNKTVYFPKLDVTIGVRSVDQEINWKSLEITLAWIDEAQAWPQEAYDMVLGRLRGTDRQRSLFPDMPLQAYITANPTHTFNHWLYERTHHPNIATGKPPIKLYQASTYENPFLPKDYIERMENAYDPEIAEAELHGRFINIGKGRVFRCFDRHKHYLSVEQAELLGLPPLSYDPYLPLCWSHDFNLDPLCSVLFQWRRVNVQGYQRDVMFIYDAIRIEGALISDAPKELMNRPEALAIAERNGIILYGDASGSQRNLQTGDSNWIALDKELRRIGLRGQMRVGQSNPLHTERAAAANRMFMDSQGNIGVVVAENANTLYLVLDFEKMCWKPGTTLFDIAKPKPGEVLPKAARMTHLADAATYPIATDYPFMADAPPPPRLVR